ncbi:protein neprosin-like [Cicer arietinum]|uniref:Uncharacterized protein LOC101513850 n=1 Tax=Cicer arietinum TaxID=3827 RepID=A0A3Q7Y3H9_CICAR|nr:uncharacterized protein LOC101513850 [Cicer arietinum]
MRGRLDVEMNKVTVVSVLPAVADLSSLDLGVWIHGFVQRNRLDEDVHEKFDKLKKSLSNHLQWINKFSLKTIMSPDGDIIDCVLSHKQPAFDHPLLKGQKPLDPPEIPKGHNQNSNLSDNFQLWSLSGESCPENTIPIRRIKEEDMYRANSISRFGRKLNYSNLDIGNKHEHSIAYVTRDRYYGAKAKINVWAPHVENYNEFSLAQIWILAGTFGKDLNSIEAGWQVNQQLYGDHRPRLFIYWTADAYHRTGCYNLLCSGFVQTNKNIALGASIYPTSSYNGRQYDITLLIWKDTKTRNWWLSYGSENLIGYWPSSLFRHLKDSATVVEFGGEIINSMSQGTHTSTQMGSGHFAQEGFRKAAYFRNMQVVNDKNYLTPLSNPVFQTEFPNCYNIKGGKSNQWGNYFYYGGPGRNVKCP